MLCPFEAVKVRVQTQPGFAKGLSDGLPKFVKSEGALGYGSHLKRSFQLHGSIVMIFLIFFLQ